MPSVSWTSSKDRRERVPRGGQVPLPGRSPVRRAVSGSLVRRRLELNIDPLLEEIGCSLIAIPRGFDPELDAEVVEADANSCRRDPGDRKNLHRVPGQF